MCMQAYSPGASLALDVTVPKPAAAYKVPRSLVKATHGAARQRGVLRNATR
jgi:hypothetical protein